MEISKQKEITEKLSEAVLNCTNEQDREKAVNAYDSWLRTLSEIEKNEQDTKLKREIHDDELLNRRDDIELQNQKEEEELKRQELKEEEEKYQKKVQFWIDNGVKIVSTTVTTITTCAMLRTVSKAVKAELNGEPTFGWLKTMTANFSRSLIGIKIK